MPEQTLTMKVIIWKQEQQFLFDYRTQPNQDCQFRYILITLQLPKKGKKIYYLIHQAKPNLKIDKQILIQRRKQLYSSPCQQIQKQIHTNYGYKLMCAFQIEHQAQKGYFIKAIDAKNIERKSSQAICKSSPFLIIRTVQKWPLKLHQQIKFGKLNFTIDELVICKQQINQMNCDQSDILDLDEKVQESRICSTIQNNEDEEERCKVCFIGQDKTNPQNVLVTPCNCQGSIKYIHVQCLKQWITHKMTKITYESNGNIKVKNKQCCQICKMKIPMCIKKNGKIIPLNNFIEGFQPYLAVHANANGIYATTQSQSQQAFITFDVTNNIKIGRADDNGLNLSEQTVSRIHAELKIENNKCYIYDSKSKYGTLLYDQDARVELGKRLVGYQILNTVYTFSI